MADRRAAGLAKLVEPLRVAPGTKVNLARDYDPGSRAGWLSKKDGEETLRLGVELLSEYQDRLAAQSTYSVLLVLQAMDAAGKDGTIRHVMGGVNPQGVRVHSFKVPSMEELNHDYLWRYVTRLPERGQIGIFNRSHYEEVLVVRVHPELLERQRLPPSARRGNVWRRRFHEINEWERHLSDSGTRIVKVFLNLSREEQRVRLLRRIDLPEKNWKFSTADVHERAYWDSYQRAITEMLTHTSTEWAPWYVIPADHKWFARIAVASVLARTLIEINPQYPVLAPESREQLAEMRIELEAQAPHGASADPFEDPQAKRGARKRS
jgi:PPK2 family polyphosphate:nucleotide phosphotransferase